MEQTTATAESLVRVAVSPESIDKAFKEFDHWVCWRAVPKEDGEGFDKIPLDPKTGKRASTTDSRTWNSFPEVLEAYDSGRYDGIGFVFSSGDPFVGIDIDNCRDLETGEVSDRVLDYIKQFENAYVEASVSGKGIHLVTCGKLRGGTNRKGYEVYGQERFFTMTGEVIDV
jgi:primase-polymerase (primpol)-like protein